MFELNNWLIDLNNNYSTLINNSSFFAEDFANKKFLLNKNKKHFDLIEKFVYEIASFHLNILNLELNSNIHIEFYINNKNNNNLKLENNNDYKPILKTITNLYESNNPTLITNIDNESYKFKNFCANNFICFSKKKKLKHLSFKGGDFYHAETIELDHLKDEINLDLIVNIWNCELINVKYYNDTENNILYNQDENLIVRFDNNANNFKNIDLENEPFVNLLENIFYKKDYEVYNLLYNISVNYLNDYDIIFFDISNIIDFNNNSCNTDVADINLKKDMNIFLRKYQQRFCYKNFYNTFSCNWIIKEIENYLKNNEETVINIENIPSVLNFILTSFEQVIKFLCLSYCIDEGNKRFEIINIFISKNDINNKTGAYFTKDNSSFSVKILLNNYFNGGRLIFDDDLIMNFEKGELIIHSKNSKYSYSPIETGTQYILNGLINIYDL